MFVAKSTHDSVIAARDAALADLTKLREEHAAAQATIATLTADKDMAGKTAEAALAERDTIKAALDKAAGEVNQAKAALTAEQEAHKATRLAGLDPKLAAARAAARGVKPVPDAEGHADILAEYRTKKPGKEREDFRRQHMAELEKLLSN